MADRHIVQCLAVFPEALDMFLVAVPDGDDYRVCVIEGADVDVHCTFRVLMRAADVDQELDRFDVPQLSRWTTIDGARWLRHQGATILADVANSRASRWLSSLATEA